MCGVRSGFTGRYAFPLFLARKLNDQDSVLGSQSDEDDKTDLT